MAGKVVDRIHVARCRFHIPEAVMGRGPAARFPVGEMNLHIHRNW